MAQIQFFSQVREAPSFIYNEFILEIDQFSTEVGNFITETVQDASDFQLVVVNDWMLQSTCESLGVHGELTSASPRSWAQEEFWK